MNHRVPRHPVGMSHRQWYREIYLKSEHWFDLRKRALQHHGKQCYSCRATKHLQVHHLRYKNIHDVTIEDLQVLCKSCHKIVHQYNDKSSNPHASLYSPKKSKMLARDARRRRLEWRRANRKPRQPRKRKH